MKNRAIILAAFGTSTAARDTYEYIENKIKERFPREDFYWAFTSEKIRKKISDQNIVWKSIPDVLTDIENKGYKKAVIQSLHIVPGIEFEGICKAADKSNMQVSVGMPLLSNDIDCFKIIKALSGRIPDTKTCATLLVGHGTPHSGAGTLYIEFKDHLKSQFPSNVFISMISGVPSWVTTLKEIKKSGMKRLKIIPFMLVAGEHILNDVLGSHDESWAAQLKGYELDDTEKGLGFNDEIIDIYGDHLMDALQ
jgi:sirohydrochlorin cobaltochelatase